jgi:ADP-heptose:LPS heptosyltransferase
MSVRTILIEASLGIGDMIALTPMIRSLRRTHPHAMLSILSRRGGYFADRKIPHIDEIIVPGGPNGYLRLLRRRFDLLLMPGYYRSTNGTGNTIAYRTLFWLIPARQRITLGNLDAPCNRHTSRVDVYLRLLKMAGIDIPDQDRDLGLPLDFSSTRALLHQALAEAGLPGQRSVVVHIGSKAGYQTRDWPAARWQTVLEHLWRIHQMPAVFIGTADDEERTQSLRRTMRTPSIDLVSKLSLEETAAVINDASLFISTNSGPMWIAAALKKPQISVCGPSKEAWDPLNPNAIVLRTEIQRPGCLPPCDARTCAYSDNACMNRIESNDVLSAIERLIA